MKAICKKTSFQGFDLKKVTTVLSNNFDYSYGGYGLEINKEYIVMVMMIYQDTNCLYFLIDTNGKPDWFPYLLFEISDHSLSKDWFIKLNNEEDENNIYYLCGFDELCKEDGFFYKLLDREEEAMQTYFKGKIEIEKTLY
ncbi:MAG: hypothetical protein ACRDE5_03215 [Ginsengibacter sp.]